MAHPHPLGAAAPVIALPTAAANPITQHPRRGRLPSVVAKIATARRRRAADGYDPQSRATPAFVNDDLVRAAFEHLEHNTVTLHAVASSPAAVATYLRARIGAKDREFFTVLFLDAQHRVLSCEDMFAGTVSQATVHPREVARRALQLNASAVILSHNHPSGSLRPSPADQALTFSIKNTLNLIEVKVLDHIIVHSTGAYSMEGQSNV